MKKIKHCKPAITAALLILCSAFTAVSVFFCLVRTDNKYNAKAEVTQEGAVILPSEGVRFLVDAWQMVPDQLLTSDDFKAGITAPSYIVWAGEYPNLAAFHNDGNLYGAATYRLIIQGEGIATLLLPEPLCAARVYAAGQDLGGPGNVAQTAYQPLIRDTLYTFDVQGETELIIQIANYSHYYGGLWFPPAIGSADAIGHMLAARMIFYGLLCFSSLALAIFCVVLWFGKKAQRDPLTFWFGFLCLTFAVRVCYPFLRLGGVPLTASLYALEDIAALSGLYCAVQISLFLFWPADRNPVKTVILIIALGMCGAGVLIPLFILPAFPSFMLVYGPLISGYKLLAALFLILTAIAGCLQGRPHAKGVLTAVSIHGVSLLCGVLTVGRFEPMIGGWPEEYGAFCMVLAFAALMIRRSQAMAAENLRLTIHLKEEVEEKTQHLTQLLRERGQLMAELGHDMKSPLTALSNMAQIIRMNDILLNEKLREKMQGIEDQCQILAARLQSIQQMAAEAETPPHPQAFLLNPFLDQFYRNNQPVVEMTGPDFLYESTSQPCWVMGEAEKLIRALENLVFNAADFTPPEGCIKLSLQADEHDAILRVSDTGCGIADTELPKIFDRFYTTREEDGGQGLGLAITRAIILEQGGKISVESAVGKGSIFTIRLPLIQVPWT